MGPHDDEVRTALLSEPDNRVCWMSDGDFDVPCAVEGTSHEVLETCERILVGISPYDGRLRQRLCREPTGNWIKASLSG
jgi:hypothetical protein